MKDEQTDQAPGRIAPERIDANLREWVKTTLDCFLAPLNIEASQDAINTLTQVIECRAKEHSSAETDALRRDIDEALQLAGGSDGCGPGSLRDLVAAFHERGSVLSELSSAGTTVRDSTGRASRATGVSDAGSLGGVPASDGSDQDSHEPAETAALRRELKITDEALNVANATIGAIDAEKKQAEAEVSRLTTERDRLREALLAIREETLKVETGQTWRARALRDISEIVDEALASFPTPPVAPNGTTKETP